MRIQMGSYQAPASPYDRAGPYQAPASPFDRAGPHQPPSSPFNQQAPLWGNIVPDSPTPSVFSQQEPSFEGWTPDQILEYRNQNIKASELGILNTAAGIGDKNADAAKHHAVALKEGAVALQEGTENHKELLRQIDEYNKRNTPSKTPSGSGGGIMEAAYSAMGSLFSPSAKRRPEASSQASSQASSPMVKTGSHPANDFKLGNWYVGDSTEYAPQLDRFLEYAKHVWQVGKHDHAKEVSIRFLSFLFGSCNHKEHMRTFLDFYPRKGELFALLDAFGWVLKDPSAFIECYTRKFKAGMKIKYCSLGDDGGIQTTDAVILVSETDLRALGTFKIQLGNRERDTSIERILPMGRLDNFVNKK
jgi:hypothetical protein